MPLAVWTGPVVGSLIISICALIGSAISIVWQIYTWRHNGPRVTVKAAHAVTAGPIGRQDFIAITAANDGRASTIAHQFGFKLPNDRIFVQPLSELPVELPAELKPGGEVTYYFSRKGLQRAAAKRELGAEGSSTIRQNGAWRGRRLRVEVHLTGLEAIRP